MPRRTEERNQQKKIWSRERSGQEKEHLNVSERSSEAGGVLLISPRGEKVVLLKIHRH